MINQKQNYQSTYDDATLTILDILRKKGVANNFDDVLREYKKISMEDISKNNKKVIEEPMKLVKRKYI